MFGLGMGEMILIGIIALIFIGPKKLPEMAKNLGKGIRDFQNAAKGFTDEVQNGSKTTDAEPNLVEMPHENHHADDTLHGDTIDEDTFVHHVEADQNQTPENSDASQQSSEQEGVSADIAGIPGKNHKPHS